MTQHQAEPIFWSDFISQKYSSRQVCSLIYLNLPREENNNSYIFLIALQQVKTNLFRN